MQERGTKYTPAPTAHSSARCKFVNDFLQLIFVLFSTNFFLRTVNDLQWSVFLTVWVLRNWGNFQFHSFCFEFSALRLPVFPRPWPCSELTFYPLKQRECLVLLDWIINATRRFGRKSSDCRWYSLGVKLHDSVNANKADSYDQRLCGAVRLL